MSTPPTYDDVKLILQLYEMRREARLRAGRAWFASTFKVKDLEGLKALCPPGSDENASYRMVTTYWEMVASFVTAGVLHRELFFQSGRELLLVWERMRELVPLVREANRDAAFLANLEAVAREFAEWWEKRSPGATQAFAERVRG
jgi:hypothetical protein